MTEESSTRRNCSSSKDYSSNAHNDNNQDNSITDEVQGEPETRALELISRAEKWCNENASVWRAIERLALEEARNMRIFTVQGCVEQVRMKGSIDPAGEAFKINNSFVAVFSRMLIAEHPEVKPYIKLRKSIVDGLI